MISGYFTRVSASAVVLSTVLAAPSASAQQAVPPQPGSGQPATAGYTIQLSLEEAVRRAVENNPDLAVVKLGTEIETARVRETQTAFTPVLTSIAGRSSDVLPASNFLLGDRGVDTNDLFSSAGVRQRLPWGAGTWNLSWEVSRTTSDNPLNSFEPAMRSGLLAAFSQPLLRDFKIDPVRHQYVIARRNQDSSELLFRESVVQTVAAVKQGYWTLKASRANVTVHQRSLELAQELVTQNKARVDVGQAPPLDLVQAEAEVASRRENLIRAAAAAEEAEDRLRRLIMDPADSSFWRVRLEPVDQPESRGPLPDVDAAVSQAQLERYDVARARNEQGNAESNIQFFKNQKLPDVRLEASYRASGLGGTQLVRSGPFPGEITGRLNSGFGDVLDQVLTNDFPAWSVGVTVSYPLGRSAEEVNLLRAEIERRQAGQRVASLQLNVAESIRQAARQVRSTAEREEAARAGVTFAAQRFDAEQKRYAVGLSTSFLVTQAQRDLVQAEVNLLQAMLDHQSSRVNFEALQLAPPLAPGESVGLRGADIVLLPTQAPRGIFRESAGGGF